MAKDIYRGGCPDCPGSADVLEMDTVLYNGFGGYSVNKNGDHFYSGAMDAEWESFKTLAEIEKEAAISPAAKWEVILNNSLRGATWERQKDGHWILIETNRGFA